MIDISVLITDAESAITLIALRSLGRRQINVTVASEKARALSFFSKYCERRMAYPSPFLNRELFIKKLLNVAESGFYETIFPISNEVILLISANKEKFKKYLRVPVADYEIFKSAYDKSETIKIAMECGIPCPETYFPGNISDVERLKKRIAFPAVIKPVVSFGARGLAYANSPEHLVRKCRDVSDRYGAIVVQEYIPHGGAYGFEALFNEDSEPRAIFMHRRIREYPLSGGPSTMRESVYNSEIRRLGTKLLKAMGWYGVAMVEFMLDPRDGKMKLMEVNPRFWGSLQLSVSSGIDFPYLLYKMAMDGDVKPVMDYRLGVKCRSILFDDVKHIIGFLRGGNSAKSKLEAVADFMKFYEKDLHYDIISLDDPKPAFFKIADTVINGVRGLK